MTQLANTVQVSQEARLDTLWLTAFLPHFNGQTVMKPKVAERAAFIDACLDSAGGYCRSHGFYRVQFPQALKDCNFCIASLEAFNLLIALRLWAREWQGLKVLIYTDNWASACTATSGVAQDPLIRAVYRKAWRLCMMHDIHMTVRHRPGASMEAADLLSRDDGSNAFAQRLREFMSDFGSMESRLLAD